MNKPARLKKCNSSSVLEEQLSITVKEMLIIIFLVFLFFMISLWIIPQTYGFL